MAHVNIRSWHLETLGNMLGHTRDKRFLFECWSYFNFAAQGAIYYLNITTLILRVSITCFPAKAHLSFHWFLHIKGAQFYSYVFICLYILYIYLLHLAKTKGGASGPVWLKLDWTNPGQAKILIWVLSLSVRFPVYVFWPSVWVWKISNYTKQNQ